jgi:hypothetical protein
MATYSLAEVAAEVCGDSMDRPERWLTRGIEAGRFRARKVGRQWRMTRADIDALLDAIANTVAEPAPTTTQPADVVDPAMFVSRRRRLAVAK